MIVVGFANSATPWKLPRVRSYFRDRPYWSDSDVPLFVERLQALIDGARFRKIPPRAGTPLEMSAPAFSSLMVGHTEESSTRSNLT